MDCSASVRALAREFMRQESLNQQCLAAQWIFEDVQESTVPSKLPNYVVVLK